jgi:hypothetical protein
MEVEMHQTIRTYSELIRFESFEDRCNYLKLSGSVGRATFGYERYLNQALYKSKQWKRVRDSIIVRDNGCDLGMIGYEIYDSIIIHHLNPITADDITYGRNDIFNPEFLITTSLRTHNAIHYGTNQPQSRTIKERKPNDTCPWKEDYHVR